VGEFQHRLPIKLKIFVYLADIDRLSSRANLFFKNCAQTDQCAACSNPGAISSSTAPLLLGFGL
jgi:hypothetical protein